MSFELQNRDFMSRALSEKIQRDIRLQTKKIIMSEIEKIVEGQLEQLVVQSIEEFRNTSKMLDEILVKVEVKR
jgi:hypothetical protein